MFVSQLPSENCDLCDVPTSYDACNRLRKHLEMNYITMLKMSQAD
jgi:hypothetical protein